MNYKKLVLCFGFAILLTTPIIISSCKKGANDPTISLRSRDARIEGKWNMKKMEGKVTESLNSSVVTSYSNIVTIANDGYKQALTLDQTLTSTTSKLTTRSFTKNQSYSLVLEIKKDQTFVATITTSNIDMKQTTDPAVPNPDPVIFKNSFTIYPVKVGNYTFETLKYDEAVTYDANSNVQTIEGNWSWEDGVKNKTYIVLNGFGKFYVDALKNKNLTLKSNDSNTNVTTNVLGGVESSSSSLTYTFEQ
jgi:hypothetical protein